MTFVCMIKVLLLAQFPVDHLIHSVVSVIIIIICKFFAPVLNRWLFSEVWVTASLPKSPAVWSILADFNNAVIWMVSIFPSDFQFQVFGDCSKCTNYNWYCWHLHAPQFSEFSGKDQVFVYLFIFFYFHSMIHWNNKTIPFFSYISHYIKWYETHSICQCTVVKIHEVN